MSYWATNDAAPGWEGWAATLPQNLPSYGGGEAVDAAASLPSAQQQQQSSALSFGGAPAQQQAPAAAGRPSAQQIAEFFHANKSNPAAIVAAANQYGLTANDIGSALGANQQEIAHWMAVSGIQQGQGGLQMGGGQQQKQTPLGGYNIQEALAQARAPGAGSNNGGSVLVNGKWVMPQYGNQRWEGQGADAVLVPGEATEYWIADDMGNAHANINGGSAQYEGKPYHRVDAQGNYIGSNNYKDMGVDKLTSLAGKVAVAGMVAAFGAGIANQIAQAAASQGISVADAAAQMGYQPPPGLETVSGTDAAATLQSGPNFSQGFTDGGTAGGALDGTYATGSAGTPWTTTAGGGVLPNGTGGAVSGAGGAGGAGGGSGLSFGAGPPVGAAGGLLGGLGSLAGPAAAVVGGAVTAGAAKDAADAQAKAGTESNALLKYIYDDQKAQNKPFYDTGVKGINRMADVMGLSGNKSADGYGSLTRRFDMQTDYIEDPGYKFRLSEGNKALDRAAAAKGSYFSGRAAKDLTRFAEDSASQEFGNAYDRWDRGNTTTFNRLASVAGVGQTAAGQTQAAGSNYGNQAAANITGIGNATAAGKVGAANALTGGISQGVSMYSNNELVNRILSGRGY